MCLFPRKSWCAPADKPIHHVGIGFVPFLVDNNLSTKEAYDLEWRVVFKECPELKRVFDLVFNMTTTKTRPLASDVAAALIKQGMEQRDARELIQQAISYPVAGFKYIRGTPHLYPLKPGEAGLDVSW